MNAPLFYHFGQSMIVELQTGVAFNTQKATYIFKVIIFHARNPFANIVIR